MQATHFTSTPSPTMAACRVKWVPLGQEQCNSVSDQHTTLSLKSPDGLDPLTTFVQIKMYMNSTYINCLNNFKKMYLGAVEKSYGTREEIRGSGLAIKQALKQAPEKVSITATLTTFSLYLFEQMRE